MDDDLLDFASDEMFKKKESPIKQQQQHQQQNEEENMNDDSIVLSQQQQQQQQQSPEIHNDDNNNNKRYNNNRSTTSNSFSGAQTTPSPLLAQIMDSTPYSTSLSINNKQKEIYNENDDKSLKLDNHNDDNGGGEDMLNSSYIDYQSDIASIYDDNTEESESENTQGTQDQSMIDIPQQYPSAIPKPTNTTSKKQPSTTVFNVPNNIIKTPVSTTTTTTPTNNDKDNDKNSERKLPTWMKRKNVTNADEDNFNEIKTKFESKRIKKDELLSNGETATTVNTNWLASLKGFVEVDKPITQGRVICFDLETSGFGPDDSIIEIGAVELIDGCRTGVIFQSYAQPKTAIHPLAEEIHQLSNFLLQTSPPIEVILASFMDWVGDSPLIAHNLAFDKRMLIQELIRTKIPFNPDHKCFCTMKYFRKVYSGSNYSLDSVSQQLKINKILLRKTHGALVDSEILAIIYKHLMSLPANLSILKLMTRLNPDNNNNNSNNISNDLSLNQNNDKVSTPIDNTKNQNEQNLDNNNNNNNNNNLNNNNQNKQNIKNESTNNNNNNNLNNNSNCIIDHIDHLVLTTRNVEKCLDFYTRVLGFQKEEFVDINQNRRLALKFGNQKINIHEFGKEFKPHAQSPTPGSIDICFISSVPLRDVINRLIETSVKIEDGPVPRTGATRKLLSIYIRDPDLNLVEISEYL
eukprot:gene11138-13643_t